MEEEVGSICFGSEKMCDYLNVIVDKTIYLIMKDKENDAHNQVSQSSLA